MKKIIYLIAFVIFAFSFSSCGNSKGYTWTGKVAPGEYSGNYNFSMSGKTANVKIQLLLENDGSYELRETWSGGGCYEGTRTYHGRLRLYEENYNGSTKRWYTINNGIQSEYSLSENLELRNRACDTYQDFSNSEKYCTLRKL